MVGWHRRNSGELPPYFAQIENEFLSKPILHRRIFLAAHCFIANDQSVALLLAQSHELICKNFARRPATSSDLARFVLA
jgi:hypothetical protein